MEPQNIVSTSVMLVFDNKPIVFKQVIQVRDIPRFCKLMGIDISQIIENEAGLGCEQDLSPCIPTL